MTLSAQAYQTIHQMFFAVELVSLFGMVNLKVLSTATITFPSCTSLYLFTDNAPIGSSEEIEVLEFEDIGLDLLPIKVFDDGDHLLIRTCSCVLVGLEILEDKLFGGHNRYFSGGVGGAAGGIKVPFSIFKLPSP